MLKSADIVKARFGAAIVVLPFMLGLVAIGGFVLAMAPNPKPADKADAAATSVVTTGLVRLTTNEKSRAALACAAPVVEALRVATSDDSTTLVTLPSADCPNAVELKFPVVGFSGEFGTFEVVPPVIASPGPS